MSVRKVILIPALALSLALFAGSAKAASLTFTDIGPDEATTLAATGFVPPNVVTVTVLGPQLFQANITNAVVAVAQDTVNWWGAGAEEFSGTPTRYSDLVSFRTFAQSTVLQITFQSDPDVTGGGEPSIGLIPPIPTYNGNAIETGALQNVLFPPNLPTLTITGGLTVTIASDAAIPEPASVVMMGTGLVGLPMLLALRRKKKAAMA